MLVSCKTNADSTPPPRLSSASFKRYKAPTICFSSASAGPSMPVAAGEDGEEAEQRSCRMRSGMIVCSKPGMLKCGADRVGDKDVPPVLPSKSQPSEAVPGVSGPLDVGEEDAICCGQNQVQNDTKSKPRDPSGTITLHIFDTNSRGKPGSKVHSTRRTSSSLITRCPLVVACDVRQKPRKTSSNGLPDLPTALCALCRTLSASGGRCL